MATDEPPMLLKTLTAREHIEFDQRMRRALEVSGSPTMEIDEFALDDARFFQSLVHLNCVAARQFDLSQVLSHERRRRVPIPAERLDDLTVGGPALRVFERALSARAEPRTLGTGDFLKALAAECLDNWTNKDHPRTLDMLAYCCSQAGYAPWEIVRRMEPFLRDLGAIRYSDDDFQFFVGMRGRRIVFRVATCLRTRPHCRDRPVQRVSKRH
jgi:hypothetical protein